MKSRTKSTNNRRHVYLALAHSVESQLREAYGKKHDQGEETQTSLADKLGTDKATINRRLKGQTNMTLKTIADMVWGLGHCISVEIFDPKERPTNRARIEPIGFENPEDDDIQLNVSVSDETTDKPSRFKVVQTSRPSTKDQLELS